MILGAPFCIIDIFWKLQFSNHFIFYNDVQFLITFTQLTARLKTFLRGWLLVLGLKEYLVNKVSFFGLCSKMQIIPIKNLNIKKVVLQFLWFFRLKCWFKGQTISRIHLSLPNAYKLMCFDRNINGNRDVKFLIAIIGHCTDQRKLLYWLSLLNFSLTLHCCVKWL